MSRFFIFMSVVALIILLVDLYAFKGFNLMAQQWPSQTRKILRIGYWFPTGITFMLFLSLVLFMDYFLEHKTYGYFYFVTGFAFLFLLPKLVFSAFHLLDDLMHLTRVFAGWTQRASESEPHERITRVQFLTQLGAGASLITFGSMFYGLTRGKFAFRVIEQQVPIAGLPTSFDGARIVHISDMHIGSFLDNYDEVRRAVDMINGLNADYVFFTGDMVNNYASELEPWLGIIGGIKASKGKYSIFGNHDYGDYVQWPDAGSKSENLEILARYHEQMGFRLLRNEHIQLETAGESITLVGIENWGSGFAKYGDLEKAMAGVDPKAVKILLSHDPSHWEKQVMGQKPVQLTLSGHTHGMQFGVEIPMLNLKFSPARIRYKRWGGLYSEGEQHLYVNRGFGFLGFPGRVGIWPEITLLELVKA